MCVKGELHFYGFYITHIYVKILWLSWHYYRIMLPHMALSLLWQYWGYDNVFVSPFSFLWKLSCCKINETQLIISFDLMCRKYVKCVTCSSVNHMGVLKAQCLISSITWTLSKKICKKEKWLQCNDYTVIPHGVEI